MDFLNSLLFVGLNKEYILVDIVQGRSCKQICSVNKGAKVPFCVPIEQEGIGDENENREQGEMLLANDRRGLFYDFVGSPARGVHLISIPLCVERTESRVVLRCTEWDLSLSLSSCSCYKWN